MRLLYIVFSVLLPSKVGSDRSTCLFLSPNISLISSSWHLDFCFWGFRAVGLEYRKLAMLEALWRSLFLSSGSLMVESIQPSLSWHGGLYEWVTKKKKIVEVEGCRNTHQRDPSQLVKEGDRYVDTHGVNHWLLPCQALVFAGAECLPLLKNEIRMPLPVDFPVTNHCETCLFYVFSFAWSSGGMILLEVGLQCVLLKGIWLKKIMMGSKQSWNSWASSRPWERLPAA